MSLNPAPAQPRILVTPSGAFRFNLSLIIDHLGDDHLLITRDKRPRFVAMRIDPYLQLRGLALTDLKVKPFKLPDLPAEEMVIDG